MRVPSVRHQPNPPWLQSRYFSRNSLFALSATIVSVAVATSVLVTTNTDNNHNGEEKRSEPINSNPIYSQMEHTIEKSNASIRRILNQMKQTGMAASVLWESLRSVMSSANHEVRVGFESRVAALLADIAAASSSRRAAIVGAGGGKVVDWLLQTVAARGNNVGTQTEAARALAYLIADPNVCEVVLGRQSAVPNLLSFIFSCQPRDSKKHSRRTSFDVSDSLKGRSMLITALMDVVTSHCNNLENPSFQPSLPANAVMRDIAAAIQVIEEGGLHLNVTNENDDDDSGKGIKGIGIKVLGGTTVLGLSQTSGLANVEHFDANHLELLQLPMHWNHAGSSLAQASVSSTVVPGLWDDLHCQHVAVPFATWALANWAMASDVNRFHIHELDHNGHAVLTALAAPERSVKWHASLVAQSLLDDRNLPLKDSVSDWSSSLLSTIHQASKTEDISLAQITLSAFLLSVERSHAAQQVIMEKGLHLMRGTAKQTENHKNMQDSLAKTLELLCTRDTRLSLEESQRWSGVLFPWVFGDVATEATRSSATKILSCILEDYGPSAVPMSQGWLTFLLTEILSASRIKKGSTQPKSDKVKTNIDQSYILTATQVANQLAGAVVNLAGYQLGATTASFDTFPLAALLSLEPFAGPFRNLKKENLPKVDAADSAAATLKGIKALTEVCMDDSMCQNKIVDHGVLCLLRRLLICDDYEKLAAVEAYDASRDHEAKGKNLNVSGDSHTSDPSCSSSVRVPPTAHIRRHATRLLTMLSLLPKVQKVVAADETLCEWLEECANGKIPGCGDLKIQSYARATLLNIFCSNETENSSSNDAVSGLGTLDSNRLCPRFADMIFLVNPEMSHWKFPENTNLDSISRKCHELKKRDSDNGLLPSGINNVDSERKQVIEDSGDCSSKYESSSLSEDPLLDVVFIHGLRGGPYKTWRIADDKSSTTRTGLVEKIDEEAGKQGTFWPSEWLAADFPQARLFTIKYKTNLTQWSGASLPLQEVSSMLLETLVAAGIGDRPVVFVTHSMGGLVVKQLLHKAKEENIERLVNNTIGVVFYSCPHFGSKLADMPWRMGLVFRPAPTIGELRSGSPRLVELNDFLRHLHKKGMLEVLSFCETKVTPIVEGYGGWAFRLEIVPIESAYPGFGELVVLESTDHINSCKPVNRADPSYTEILNFLNKLKARLS